MGCFFTEAPGFGRFTTMSRKASREMAPPHGMANARGKSRRLAIWQARMAETASWLANQWHHTSAGRSCHGKAGARRRHPFGSMGSERLSPLHRMHTGGAPEPALVCSSRAICARGIMVGGGRANKRNLGRANFCRGASRRRRRRHSPWGIPAVCSLLAYGILIY